VVRARRILLGILLACLACAPSYVKKSAPVLDRLSREDYDEALSTVENLKSDPFLYLVEKGTILHYAGRYEESNQVLTEAEELREDLIVPSITEGTVSLVTSDLARSYGGEDYEDIFINYYKILNYLFLSQFDEALVEARKVDIKLKALEDLYEGKLTHTSDAFMRYLTGVLYEFDKDYNNAFIAYELSYRAYGRYSELYETEAPPFLAEDLVRTAVWSNLPEKTEYYRGQFSGLNRSSFSLSDTGQVLLIFENGILPHKEEKVVEMLIPREEEPYLAKIALPTIGEKRAFFSRAKVRVGLTDERTWIAEDLQAIAIQNLKDRELRDIARAAARAGLKYALTEGSKKVGERLGRDEDDTTSTERSEILGKVFGVAANLFGYATERADLRSWRSLPQNVQLGKVVVPEGTYDVHILLLDAGGRVSRTVTYPDVQVNEGEITLLRYRSY